MANYHLTKYKLYTSTFYFAGKKSLKMLSQQVKITSYLQT